MMAASAGAPCWLFARLGRTVTAHPGRVAAGWVLVVVSLMAISGALHQPPPSSAVAAQLPAGYESTRAQAAMDKAFGAPSSDATAVLVVSRADGRRLTTRDLAVADRAVASLLGAPNALSMAAWARVDSYPAGSWAATAEDGGGW